MTAPDRSLGQLEVAARLGIDTKDDTFRIAAARLLDAVALAVGHEPPVPSSERQRSFASSLGVDVAADSKRVATAKIAEVLELKNQQAIAALDLQP